MTRLMDWLRGFTEWLMRLFVMGPRQAVGEGEGTVDVHNLPCNSGATTSQCQGVDSTSQISGTSEERPFKDTPPYIPECEVFKDGGLEAGKRLRLCARNCRKDFIPVKEVTMDHLPVECRNERRWKDFEQLCARTVKLVSPYTSVHRPDTHPNSTAPYPYAEYKGSEEIKRTGTGLIIPYHKSLWVRHARCPCPNCKCQESGEAQMGYFRVIVLTAAHVVFDDSEAEKTVCEVFDDDPENKKSIKLYGVKGVDMESFEDDGRVSLVACSMFKQNDMDNIEKRPRHDMFAMECVSHDTQLYKILKAVLNKRDNFDDMTVIVSHPHGFSKMVSIGTFGVLRIQLSQTHTPDTQYTIPAGSWVDADIDPTTLCPEFFKKHPHIRTWYRTTQSVHLYIPCDTPNSATFRPKKGSINHYFLPEGSRCCGVVEGTNIPVDGVGFPGLTLLDILKHNDISHHYAYDIHTCNGSSGAFVPMVGGLLNNSVFHFGKLPGGRLNRSGQYTNPVAGRRR